MITGTGESAERAQDRSPHRVLPVTDRLWTIPNILSIVRLLLLPVFIWCLVQDRYGWAGLVLVISGLTDYLDGRIARSYGLVSKLGQVLDPIADRLYIATTLISLAWIGVIPWWLLGVLVARDAFILAMYPIVRRHHLPIPPVDFVGKAATFNLLGAFPLLLFGHVAGWWTTLALVTGWALAWWGTVLYWATGLIYAWQVRHMLRQARALEVPV
ncbi:CDP-alcohol phosphatidyltransferase family protein [Ornithinimicrobium sp. Y1847]|uniref:CDP-alcohol phosphatidyltransferase family protein n=1 Tax=unclassified Ornithinimicrobium TaxID=2615080 RepID=UPI003B66D970